MTIHFRLPPLALSLNCCLDGFICFLLLFLSFKRTNTSLLPPFPSCLHLRPTERRRKITVRVRAALKIPSGEQLGRKMKQSEELIIAKPLSLFPAKSLYRSPNRGSHENHHHRRRTAHPAPPPALEPCAAPRRGLTPLAPFIASEHAL